MIERLSQLLFAYQESYQVRRIKGIIENIGKEIAAHFLYPAPLVKCCLAAFREIGLEEMADEVQGLWDEKYEAKYWFEKEGKRFGREGL